MNTALYCPRCRAQCGEAKQLDPDVVHVSVVDVTRPGEYSGLPVHVTRGWTLRLSDPDGWPLAWHCEPCHTAVGLTTERARSVGHVKRLRVDSMPSVS